MRDELKQKPLTQLEGNKRATVRSSYVICGAQSKKKQAEILVQSLLKTSRWQQQSIKPSTWPSECGAHVNAQIACP